MGAARRRRVPGLLLTLDDGSNTMVVQAFEQREQRGHGNGDVTVTRWPRAEPGLPNELRRSRPLGRGGLARPMTDTSGAGYQLRIDGGLVLAFDGDELNFTPSLRGRHKSTSWRSTG